MVVVPAWRKPDFLAATLHRLALAEDSCEEKVGYIVCVDRHPHPDVLEVAWQFRDDRRPGLVVVKKRIHEYHGNSFNVLTGLIDALKMPGADLIHLVEDDVFAGVDYFTYHRAAHELMPEAFAVSACRNQNDPERHSDKPYILRAHASYQSLGVSFQRKILYRLASYAQEGYFRDPVGFCQAVFPDSRIPAPHAEQDGLLNRIRESHGLKTVYPDVPRAYHAGFVGYHRAGDPLTEGTAAERGLQLLAMDAEELNRRAEGPWKDHETIDLDEVRKGPERVIL
jgi:hypothetical protein